MTRLFGRLRVCGMVLENLLKTYQQGLVTSAFSESSCRMLEKFSFIISVAQGSPDSSTWPERGRDSRFEAGLLAFDASPVTRIGCVPRGR
jgi:hypothetical protein